MWAAEVWVEQNTNRQANSDTHANAQQWRASVSDSIPAAAAAAAAPGSIFSVPPCALEQDTQPPAHTITVQSVRQFHILTGENHNFVKVADRLKQDF